MFKNREFGKIYENLFSFNYYRAYAMDSLCQWECGLL